MADVNVRISDDLIEEVRKVLELVKVHPSYAPMHLSQSALIRLALSKGLETLRNEVGKEGRAATRKKK